MKEMEKASNLMNNKVSGSWVKSTKETNAATDKTQATEEKIVSRVSFEPSAAAPVSFNTYQDILDKRNQMLGMVKPSMYQYDIDSI